MKDMKVIVGRKGVGESCFLPNNELREKSLEWFFAKNEVERIELKDKYFPDKYIPYDSHFGYHFTFGQIEQMYKAECENIS